MLLQHAGALKLILVSFHTITRQWREPYITDVITTTTFYVGFCLMAYEPIPFKLGRMINTGEL